MFTYLAYFEDGTRAWFNGKGAEKKSNTRILTFLENML